MQQDPTKDLCLDPPIAEIWLKVLELLQARLPEPSYKAWILPTQLCAIAENEAVLAVNNHFAKARIVENYFDETEKAVQEVLGRQIKLKIAVDAIAAQAGYSPSIAAITVVDESNKNPAQVSDAETARGQEKPKASSQTQYAVGVSQNSTSNLNVKYDFDSFVVGSSNRFSHAAALAVVEKPGQAYNPLFLHGGVGLGKTHLLHAIGNAILARAPQTVIRYLSCEKFTNEVISSIREDKMSDFRKKYRRVDLLLMDDVQFIEGKESTQEEFFHTFNQLRDNGKQIVLTSDRPPKALAKLAERLRSRFEWGLIADIQPPDYEMRLAILQKKCEQEKLSLAPEVLDYIAANFTNNTRELEGALLRAHAYASLTGASLDRASLAQILLPQVQKKERAPLNIEKLIDTVAAYYRIEPSDIKSSKRSQDLTVPRHIAMYLAHEIMSLSFPRIGQAFGNRKHTSALYAHDKIKENLREDAELASAVREITRQLSL